MKNKKVLALVGALVVVVAVFAVIYFNFLPKGTTDGKTITVEVITDDVENSYTIETEEEYLRGALEQESLVEGSDSEYGLYILSVDGITADEGLQQWWCVTVDGEMAETSVDWVVLEDGKSYELTLITGW